MYIYMYSVVYPLTVLRHLKALLQDHLRTEQQPVCVCVCVWVWVCEDLTGQHIYMYMHACTCVSPSLNSQ